MKTIFISIIRSVYFSSLLKMVQTKNFSIKQFWFSKTPKEKYDFLHKVIDYSCRLVGINTFSSCKIDWKSYYPGVTMLIYYTLLIYTVFYRIHNNQFEKSFYTLCILGVVISVSWKIFFFLIEHFVNLFFNFISQHFHIQ